jgi:hypothetical protein
MGLLALIFASTFALWVLFSIIFPIYDHHRDAKGLARAALVVLVYSFVLLDVAYNLTIGSLLFWELPDSWAETFSERVQRNYLYSVRWRYRLARFFHKLITNIDREHFQ